MYPPMMGRRHFNVMPLPEQLPLLPTKPPAADEGAQFDMSFEPLGEGYASQYYKRMFPSAEIGESGLGSGMDAGPSPNMDATWGRGPGGGNSGMPGRDWWESLFGGSTTGTGGGGSFAPMMGSYKGWF